MRRAIFNQKGGVGKSTITCNLAAISAHNHRRTLVIDLDPQGNSTQYLLGSLEQECETTLVDYFEEQLYRTLEPKGLIGCIHKTPFPRLELVPSHSDLEYLAEKLDSRHKMYKLKEALDSLSHYDSIYIDTPPALNFYTRSALIASDACLIPFDCDYLSLRALRVLLDTVSEVQRDHRHSLRLEGIVVNQFQVTAKLPKRIVSELLDEGLPVLDTYLSSSIKIRESREKSLPMVYLDPRHKLTMQFEELYRKLNLS
ncbi:MAG: ParA family protein [Deltaproteobacteria bacterium]|nr:MAG: ParA family protein [Deltaproteobacteria bacterium]